jgi:cyclic lactone autoinducer peptide
MKKVLKYLASSAAAIAVFTAIISAGTASSWSMHQPKVPMSLLK